MVRDFEVCPTVCCSTGAVFLDGGLDCATKLFCDLAFDDKVPHSFIYSL